MLNLIELGAPWPQQLLHQRAALLLKDPLQPQAPMAYRILKVMAMIYRRWAAARLRTLQPWIDTWATDDLFAGIGGRSAED
eukprot:11993537-Karenia_brevis.AAC.1